MPFIYCPFEKRMLLYRCDDCNCVIETRTSSTTDIVDQIVERGRQGRSAGDFIIDMCMNHGGLLTGDKLTARLDRIRSEGFEQFVEETEMLSETKLSETQSAAMYSMLHKLLNRIEGIEAT